MEDIESKKRQKALISFQYSNANSFPYSLIVLDEPCLLEQVQIKILDQN